MTITFPQRLPYPTVDGYVKWRVLARVTGIRPRSTKVEITAVIEDNRVHQS